MPSKTGTLSLIACLSACNVAFRFVLAGGPPNIKPVAFLVIVGGIVAGPLAGFGVGFLSMTLSDFTSPFGAGVWTMETSICMGIIGLIAGLVWNKSLSFNRWRLAVTGFILTSFFDIATSVIDALLYGYPWLPAILALYVPFMPGNLSPYPFGFVHELTTAVLLGTIGPLLIRQVRKVYR